MGKQIIIKNKAELSAYRKEIESNLSAGVEAMRDVLYKENPMEIFQHFKYEKFVPEPLTGSPENLMEVINQSETYLVSIKAVEYLLERYPQQEFRINWGNIPGYDIESEDGTIIAECFAATSYRSNQKLKKDLIRLSENHTALHKYEFFHDKDFKDTQKDYYEKKYEGIKIIKFWEL